MSPPEMSPRYQQGDRVHVRKDVTTLPALPGYVGIVKEVIPCYADKTIGYNLTIEGDPRSIRRAGRRCARSLSPRMREQRSTVSTCFNSPAIAS